MKPTKSLAVIVVALLTALNGNKNDDNIKSTALERAVLISTSLYLD